MLLMQYNDNIPAVFGFPLVIPHQRRGGMEEEGREEGYWGGELFLATSDCFRPFLYLSFLLSTVPSLILSSLSGLISTTGSKNPVYIQG